MDIPFAVREQMIHGREFLYRARNEWNFVVRGADVPGDAVREAKLAVTAMLPEEYELVAVSLRDRNRGIITVRPKKLRKPAASPDAPGKISRPVSRGYVKARTGGK